MGMEFINALPQLGKRGAFPEFLPSGRCRLQLHLSCFQRVEGLCQKSHNSKEISGLSVIFLDISTAGVTI